jgi:hypothetical protein
MKVWSAFLLQAQGNLGLVSEVEETLLCCGKNWRSRMCARSLKMFEYFQGPRLPLELVVVVGLLR